MALFENFPYTNLHQLNLDWLVAEMKKVEDAIKYGPVISVNGLTGEVVLYQEANVRLPDVMNPTQTNWNIFRYLNGHVYGIEFDATGNVYQIQDQYRRKLLTWADIPPESGVISINGKYGVVRLYGSDIQTSGDDPKTVMESIYDLEELTSTLQTISNAIKNSMAYVENTNTATHNMSSGTYVLWNNGAYKVKSGTNIAIGDTLSNSNLDAIGTKGFINDLNDSISALNSNLTGKQSRDITLSSGAKILLRRYGHMVVATFNGVGNTQTTAKTEWAIPQNYVPTIDVVATLTNSDGHLNYFMIKPNGDVTYVNTDAWGSGTITYFVDD